MIVSSLWVRVNGLRGRAGTVSAGESVPRTTGVVGFSGLHVSRAPAATKNNLNPLVSCEPEFVDLAPCQTNCGHVEFRGGRCPVGTRDRCIGSKRQSVWLPVTRTEVPTRVSRLLERLVYRLAAYPRSRKRAIMLAADAVCIPAGTVIPKAEEGDKPGEAGKWVHFGKGTDTFEMALNPGEYKFAVEVGDDLHRAVEGMCETITIKVE